MFSLLSVFFCETIELYILQVFSLLSIYVPHVCQSTSSICYITNLSTFNEFVTVHNFITLIYLTGLYVCKKLYEPYVNDYHELHRVIFFYKYYKKFIIGAIIISLSNILFSSILLFGSVYYEEFTTVTTLLTSSIIVLQKLFDVLKEVNINILNRKENVDKSICTFNTLTNKNISINIDQELPSNNKIHLIKTLDKEIVFGLEKELEKEFEKELVEQLVEDKQIIIDIKDDNKDKDIMDLEEFVDINKPLEITPPSIIKKNNNNLIKNYFNYNI